LPGPGWGRPLTGERPASLLSDNAAVFTGRSRRGKVLLELELARLGVEHKHSSPYHPQTCGKVCEHDGGAETGLV